MPDPFDLSLSRHVAIPAGLDDVEAAVLARLTDAPRRGGPAGMIAIAAALGLGIGGGMLGAGASPASAAPIGMDGALAPSTLLLGR